MSAHTKSAKEHSPHDDGDASRSRMLFGLLSSTRAVTTEKTPECRAPGQQCAEWRGAKG